MAGTIWVLLEMVEVVALVGAEDVNDILVGASKDNYNFVLSLLYVGHSLR